MEADVTRTVPASDARAGAYPVRVRVAHAKICYNIRMTAHSISRWRLFAALALTAPACAAAVPAPQLCDAFPFKLGVAVSNAQIADAPERELALIARHFNSVTPENALKPQPLQPEEGVFRFEQADRYVDWAEAHGMKIIGHVLVWHSQLPQWFTRDANGELCSRETLLRRMETHITTVVGRYKGRIHGWDVVNEAVEGDGSYRQSDFYKILGEEFIDAAFRFAHAADPACELYYNDYGNESARKNATIAALVRRLKAKGLRIDAVGLQTHVQLKTPAIATYEDAIRLFIDAGVKVAITELDVSALPNAWELSADISKNYAYDATLNPWPDGLPAEVEAELVARYADWFALFRKYAAHVDRVTLWGLSDRDSWLNNFPVRGRTDYPLFFDRALNLKPWAARL